MSNQVQTGDVRDQGRGLRSTLMGEHHVEVPETVEEKFRSLAESLPQMIFSCDGNGKKDYCCQRYLDYTGCKTFEEINLSWLTTIHPADRIRTEAAWKKAMETKSTYVAQYRMRRCDGVYRHHLARAVPTMRSDGAVTHWVGTITDIDEEKQTEELLRRTEKLAAAGRMAAALAHEINNPLSSVTNALYLALQDEKLSPTTRQYLQLADRELLRVAQVTSHSLRFHRQSSANKAVNLGEILDSVVSLYEGRINSLDIRLDRQYRTYENLYCSVDDIRQVFSHLLSNAIDAMPHGGQLQLRIHLSRCWDDESSTGIKVVVADDGVGIPCDFMPRIFDAFTSTKDPTGTGLGLWVVDGIVRKHHGRILVRSSTGLRSHGTVISLFFPFLGSTE